jgi:hypothetical protein
MIFHCGTRPRKGDGKQVVAYFKVSFKHWYGRIEERQSISVKKVLAYSESNHNIQY